jgi:hypothetical protein
MAIGQKCVCACRNLPNDRSCQVISDQRDAESPEFLKSGTVGCQLQRLQLRNLFLIDALTRTAKLIDNNPDHHE